MSVQHHRASNVLLCPDTFNHLPISRRQARKIKQRSTLALTRSLFSKIAVQGFATPSTLSFVPLYPQTLQHINVQDTGNTIGGPNVAYESSLFELHMNKHATISGKLHRLHICALVGLASLVLNVRVNMQRFLTYSRCYIIVIQGGFSNRMWPEPDKIIRWTGQVTMCIMVQVR